MAADGIDFGVIALLTVLLLAAAYAIAQAFGVGQPPVDPEELEWLHSYPHGYKPEHPRPFRTADLGAFDGKDGRRLYVGAKGIVFDVGALRRGWDAYGPKGGYNVFSAADASWALATMCLNPQETWPADATYDELPEGEQTTLNEWVDKFQNFYSYPVVGWIEDGFFPRDKAP